MGEVSDPGPNQLGYFSKDQNLQKFYIVFQDKNRPFIKGFRAISLSEGRDLKALLSLEKNYCGEFSVPQRSIAKFESLASLSYNPERFIYSIQTPEKNEASNTQELSAAGLI